MTRQTRSERLHANQMRSGQPETAVRLPSAMARGFAWALALILTLLVTGLVFALIGRQAATSVTLHEQVSLDREVLNGQTAWLQAETERLAKVYDFPAERVAETLTPAEVEAMSRKVTAWWTGLIRTGTVEEIPLWDSEPLKEALRNDPAFSEGLTSTRLKGRVNQAASAVTIALKKAVFPLRDTVLTGAMKKAKKAVDLPGLARAAGQIPLLLALSAAVAAGLILLLLGSCPAMSLKMYGASAGAAAILTLLGVILLKVLNLSGMLAEVSPRLLEQYARLRDMLTWESAAAILGLAAIMTLCFARFRKAEKGWLIPPVGDRKAVAHGTT